MDRFWEPITATSSRVTYCLGVPTDAVDLQSRTIPAIPAGESGSLNVYDVITLARSIVPLVPKNGEFRVLAASETGFAQLREGPSVMIGAFDNPWTMRITQDLPIGFEYDNHVRKVVDRKSVPRRIWTLQWQVTVAIDDRVLKTFDEGKNAWNLPPGEYRVLAGSSSDNTPLIASLVVR
jgi:hypothetical protein